MHQSGWNDPHVGLDNPDPQCHTDVGIVRLPVNDPDHIVTEALFSESCIAVLPTAHPLTAATALTVADLLDQPLVHNTSPPGPFRDFWLLRDARPQGQPVREGGAHTALDEWLAAIAAGGGISLCPQSTQRYYARPGITFRPVLDAPASVVALAWRHDDLTGPAQRFLDVARGVRDSSLIATTTPAS